MLRRIGVFPALFLIIAGIVFCAIWGLRWQIHMRERLCTERLPEISRRLGVPLSSTDRCEETDFDGSVYYRALNDINVHIEYRRNKISKKVEVKYVVACRKHTCIDIEDNRDWFAIEQNSKTNEEN